jgi:hypothetical protein
MKKNIYLLALLGFFVLQAKAQAPNFEWVNTFAGSGANDAGKFVEVDSKGNIYMVGHFSSILDFDPGVGVANLSASGITDIFISKFDSAGNFIWAKKFTGSFSEDASGFIIDKNDNLVITGYFSGGVDFDPSGTSFILNTGNINMQNAFITKLDINGIFIWAKKIASSIIIFPNDITVDKSNNVIITGGFIGEADLDPNTGISSFTSLSEDLFIVKLDSIGNYVWAKVMPCLNTNGIAEASKITVDFEENIYIAGIFYDSIDCDPGVNTFVLNNANMIGFDIVISKLNKNGNFIWAKKLGGSANENIFEIKVDANQNVFSTGFFSDTADFDPGAGIANLITGNIVDTIIGQETNIFISKLDANGNYIWAKSIGDTGTFDAGYTMNLDSIGNVYVGGSFGGTVDFNPGPAVNNIIGLSLEDMFIVKLNNNGNYIWSAAFTGSKSKYIFGITIDSRNNIYTTGEYAWDTDFDPSINSYIKNSTGNTYDIFIHKLNQCKSNTGISLVNATLTSNDSNATYQWVNCPAFSLISNATNQSYVVTANGDYAVIVNQNGCIDTSACITVANLSIQNTKVNNVTVFPNITKESIFINSNTVLQGSTLKIYSIVGKLMKSMRLETTEKQKAIDVSEYANGIYILQFEKNNKIDTFKFVKTE